MNKIWTLELLTPEQRSVSLPTMNRALLYGESFFTTGRMMNGRLVMGEAHLGRLLSSVPQEHREEFSDLFWEGIEELQTRGRDFWVRPTIVENHLLFFYQARHWVENASVALKTCPFFRLPEYDLLSKVKVGDYVRSFSLRDSWREKGFDDVLFCENDQWVETSTSSLIGFAEGRFFLSSRARKYVESLSLERVKNWIYPYEFCSLEKLDLNQVQFFTINSLTGFVAIKKVDGSYLKIDLECQKKLNDEWWREWRS